MRDVTCMETDRHTNEVVCVRISMQIGGEQFVDHMLWDVSDVTSNPHAVAIVLCRDLCLPASAVHPISVQIRQQVGKTYAYVCRPYQVRT